MNVEELNLITAAVDGELSEPEQKLFRTLCSDNIDAAALYRKLQANANRLNQFRRVKAPVSVRKAVMQRIQTIQTTSTPKRSNRSRSYLPFSIAASVLFTVVSGSFWYFHSQERKSLAKSFRDQLPAAVKTQKIKGQPTDDTIIAQSLSKSELEPQTPTVPNIIPVVPPVSIAQIPSTPPEQAPLPKVITDVFGSPLDTTYRPVVSADLRFPMLVNAEELANDDIQAALKKELSRDPAYRMDFFSRNTTQATDAFVRTARSNGIRVIVDARSQELLNMKSPVTLVAYSDSLTGDEITHLMGDFTKTMNAAGKPLPVSSCHLIPANLSDQKEIRDLTGVDPSWFRARSAPAPSTDPKPISSETISKITSTVKKPEKTMILTAFGPAQSRVAPAQSKEMKLFNDRPSERKTGQLPIMFVIRPQA